MYGLTRLGVAYTLIEIGNSQIGIKTTRLVEVEGVSRRRGGREAGFGLAEGGMIE